MILKFKRTDANYTILANQILQDKRLSYKARGLFSYIWSRPKTWNVHMTDLINMSTKEGRDSIYSALKELESFNYLKREQGNDGRFSATIYHLFDSPDTDKPDTANPTHIKERVNKLKKNINIDIISFVEDFYKSKVDSSIPQLRAYRKNPETHIYKSALIVEQLIDLDDYGLDDIKDTIYKALKDSFWSKNVYSLLSLRKKSKSNEFHKFDNMFNALNGVVVKDDYKKTKNGAYLVYCSKCSRDHFYTDYHIKQQQPTSCCGVDFLANPIKKKVTNVKAYN